MVNVLHYSTPTARKEHVCDSCGREIGKGETYERQDNVFDDQRYTFKSCIQCTATANWIYRTVDSTYWEEGLDLDGYLSDVRFESGTEFRLWHYMRRRWRRLNGELVDITTIIDNHRTEITA